MTLVKVAEKYLMGARKRWIAHEQRHGCGDFMSGPTCPIAEALYSPVRKLSDFIFEVQRSEQRHDDAKAAAPR